VRQLASSLGIPVIVETSTFPAVEAGLTSQPAPKSRPKSKSHRKSRGTGNPACASSATSAETEALDENHSPDLTAIERHSRKCSICCHPYREYIEEAFLQWRSPDTIMRCWDIKAKTTIYHHAHALNLFGPRTRNLQYALGNIIENHDFQGFTPRTSSTPSAP
jgi:hypothetical protein